MKLKTLALSLLAAGYQDTVDTMKSDKINSIN